MVLVIGRSRVARPPAVRTAFVIFIDGSNNATHEVPLPSREGLGKGYRGEVVYHLCMLLLICK